MRTFLKERNIDTLYHFTRAENLENIIKYGLLPRSSIDICGIESIYNDDYRYDNCTNALCMSIEFPNYKMFYSLRMKDPDTEWAVIKLSADVLLDFQCAYCWTNAGDSTMYSLPMEERMGKTILESLFRDCEGYPQRNSLGIPSYYPTNPQAEVLVFHSVPIEYIDCIYFENQQTYLKYADVTANRLDSYVNQRLFSARRDWQFWKTR